MPKKTRDTSIPKPLLTTGDIANYCHTGMTQVNRWIKNGDLEAFRNPGGHYRVTREKFREFLERNNMPIIEGFFEGNKKKKILIADDDATIVDIFSHFLKTQYEDAVIDVAYNGYEALLKTGNLLPDLLIIDIRMPKIDGLEVCRRIRETDTIKPGPKILAMTAHSEAYDRDTVLASGADDYLLKPIEIQTLQEHIEKLI
ncbi:response regulator [Candidatus Latescibacterota bacterium]